MHVVKLDPKQTTFVYLRSNNSVKMRTIIDFAKSFYGIGGIDFIVIDLCIDRSALDIIAKHGDPFRYFGFDSGVTVDDVLKEPQKYSNLSSVIVVDQIDAP